MNVQRGKQDKRWPLHPHNRQTHPTIFPDPLALEFEIFFYFWPYPAYKIFRFRPHW